MSRRHKKRRLMAEMNVVPYIDVMLVLLVIFMVTAPMLQTGVQIDLPDANAETLDPTGSQLPLIISIDGAGMITLEDGKDTYKSITKEQLTEKIKGQLGKKNQRAVTIRADSNIAYKVIMGVMVAAQKAGATKMGLATDIETK